MKKGTTMNTSFNVSQGDSLDDLLGERTSSVKAAVVPPANYQPQDFSEPCRKCRGTGTFSGWSGRSVGPCFSCKGKGKLTFKTSAQARQRNRETAAEREAAKRLAALEAFKAEHADVWAWMDGSTFPLAQEMLAKLVKWGSLTDKQIAFCRGMIEKRDAAKVAAEERKAGAAVVDTAGVDRLKAAFDTAIAYAAAKGRGLKMPRITIGNTVISPAKATSANPGALYVKSGGLYLGKITEGRFFASRECSPEMQTKVLAFIADPKAAAEAYGIETGVCCICNATLTNKESKERGIGPICAQKFGW